MSSTTVRGAPASRMRSILTTRGSWLALIVIVIGLLAYGSVHSATKSTTDRISYLESVIKCPPCDDISIAQSDDQQAKALRVSVVKWVNEGWSDTRIENTVVTEYGPNEILLPATSGVDVLVWVLPLIGLVLGAIGIGLVLIRRRNSSNESLDLDLDEQLVQAARAEKGASS